VPVPSRLFAVAVAVLFTALGCRKQPEAAHGSPVLLQVVWEVAGTPTIVWSRDPDAAVAAQGAAAGSKIDFVFDRRLDGARVEDTVDGGPAPKANPPITVTWPDMASAMADPPFAFAAFYDSLPNWGPGTTSVFVQPRIAGLPSATEITFTLDPNGLTSVYGEPLDGPNAVTIMTTPLSVSLPGGSATVPTSYLAPISLSTRAPPAEALAPFVHVSSGGTALPFRLDNDASDAKRIFIGPADCLGGWPADTRVDIVVDAGLPDAFGRPLAAGAKGSFMTAHVAVPPPDGGCSPGDGGTSDGGTSDGGTNDGGTSDGGTGEAGDDTGPRDAGSDDTAPDDTGPDDTAPDDIAPPPPDATQSTN